MRALAEIKHAHVKHRFTALKLYALNSYKKDNELHDDF